MDRLELRAGAEGVEHSPEPIYFVPLTNPFIKSIQYTSLDISLKYLSCTGGITFALPESR